MDEPSSKLLTVEQAEGNKIEILAALARIERKMVDMDKGSRAHMAAYLDESISLQKAIRDGVNWIVAKWEKFSRDPIPPEPPGKPK